MSFIKKNMLIIFALFFISCSSYTTPYQRYNNTINLANESGWEEKNISTPIFALKSFVPIHHPTSTDILTIFIEGDGFSWVNRTTPSVNPTPKNPVALKIALDINNSSSAYLSRPCQNTFDTDFQNCTQTYWTTERFNNDVINAMNSGVSEIKNMFNAKKIKLVGYSGGGVIALLLAKQRTDVIEVITVASNIDTDAWTKYHNIEPMNVQNPALFSDTLSNIRQIHYIGKKDDVVPSIIAESYVSYYPADNRPKIYIIDDFTHHCCWEQTKSYWKY